MLTEAQREGAVLGDWVVRACSLLGIYSVEAAREAMEYVRHARLEMRHEDDIKHIGPVLKAFEDACQAQIEGKCED